MVCYLTGDDYQFAFPVYHVGGGHGHYIFVIEELSFPLPSIFLTEELHIAIWDSAIKTGSTTLLSLNVHLRIFSTPECLTMVTISFIRRLNVGGSLDPRMLSDCSYT